MGERAIYNYGPIEIESLVFVDDICSAGFVSTVETSIRNCERIEEKKKMTFNVEKSKYQVIEFEKKNKSRPNGKVKRGNIEECKEYTYLGDVTNKKGSVSDSITKKESKVNYLKVLIKKKAMRAGSKYCEVALKLYDATIKNIILNNTETWSIITKTEMNKIEKMQKEVLYYLFGMKVSTPYEGFLSEIGLRKIEHEINIRKFMLFHKFKNSNDERIAKQILEEQIKRQNENNWYSQLEALSVFYSVNDKLKEVTNESKRIWKKRIEQAVDEKRLIEFNEHKGSKSRLLTNLKREKYIHELPKNEVTDILNIRLNMTDLKDNYRNSNLTTQSCPFCNENKHTTEHVIECKKLKELTSHTLTIQNLYDSSTTNVKELRNFFYEENELRKSKEESI